jgi:hypothetical protein
VGEKAKKIKTAYLPVPAPVFLGQWEAAPYWTLHIVGTSALDQNQISETERQGESIENTTM